MAQPTPPVTVVRTSSIRIMAYHNSERSEQWFFQCNIPYEHWTERIRQYIYLTALGFAGLSEKTHTIRLGSGYFLSGMNEIFYLEKRGI